MTQPQSSQILKSMNFIVGVALLVMLFPFGGKVVAKPAGVRTAIELIDKRGAKSLSADVAGPIAASLDDPAGRA